LPRTMYDSVTLTEIPTNAYAVAGYVGGRWPTFPQLSKQFPKAKHLSIAVNSTEDAECLDIENGDATPAQAPAWIRRQVKRGVKKPVVYSSVSQMPAVLLALEVSGIKRSQVRVWTAHYTGVTHLCDQLCGFGFKTKADATQYTDKALGRNLDASLVSNAFFGTGITAAVKRKALRAWIVARHAQGWTWARLKKTTQWASWRKLGGK
jgi:hypothetical protein